MAKKKLKDLTLVEFREYCIYEYGNGCIGCPFSSYLDGFRYESDDYGGYCDLYEPIGIDAGVFETEVEIPEEEEADNEEED